MKQFPYRLRNSCFKTNLIVPRIESSDMFDLLKDKIISVVQDGLNANNNLRQTFSDVQKVKTIFKEKPVQTFDSKVDYGAGACLLDKYQQEWVEIHKCAEDNAAKADKVDSLITEIHGKTKTHFINVIDLCQSLSSLPKLEASLEECMEHLNDVKALLRTVENDLFELEDIADRQNIEQRKIDHNYHLSLYKDKKFASLEAVRTNLATYSSNAQAEREKKRLNELREKQVAYQHAFKMDLAAYRATGVVPQQSPHAHKPKEGSDLTLEQVTLDTLNDEDLDKFLNS